MMKKEIRVFLLDQNAVSIIDGNLINLVADWMPCLKNEVHEIVDAKTKLQLNADWIVESKDKFIELNQNIIACSIIVGKTLSILETAYKIENIDQDFENVPSEVLIKSPEFNEFLNTEKSKEIMNSISNDVNDVAYSDVKDYLFEIADRIINLLGEKSPIFLKNLQDIYNKKSEVILSLCSDLESKLTQEEVAIELLISSSGKKAMIVFNSAEKEYELLDKWLNTDELKLDLVNKAYLVNDEEHLVDWYNKLRSKLESECSLETINTQIKLYMDDPEQECLKISQAVSNIIAYSRETEPFKKRLEVIKFLNDMLNKFNGNDKKQFKIFTVEDLEAHERDKGYLLSIYS